MIPAPWEFVLLTLGAFRLSRLIGWDTITAGLRYRLVGFRDDEELPDLDYPPLAPRVRRRVYLATLVRCPWCQGFWVSLAVWAAWAIFGDPVVAACGLLALSSAVGLTAKNLDP